jgi:hypothetical protein
VPLEEQVKQEMEDSRFHLGPIRLLPKFLLSNAGYDSNLFGTAAPTVSDWTADVSLGLHLLLPVGPKMYLRGDALPEYDWYAHHVEKRTLGGRYAGSWLGFFNRMSMDLSGSSLKTVNHLSSENETFVTYKSLAGSADIEVNLLRRLSLLAAGEGDRVRFSSEGGEDAIVKRLDRDRLAARAGIRYRWTGFFHIAVEVEGTRTTFVQLPEAQQRDNETTAYLLGIYYNRERLFVNLNGGYRIARPHNGSSFSGFSTSTGSYFVSYFLAQPIELRAYGHRQPDYSLFSNNAYYLETRNGGGVTIRIGYRLRLQGYGEYGANDYPVPVATGGTELVNRKDHFTTVGGGLTTLFFRNASITALISRENRSSNFPGVGRSILRFTTTLSFEGKIPR